MSTWSSALALTIAGALLAGPAFAQSGGGTTGSNGTKQPGMQQPGATGTMPGGSGATGTDPAKPSAAKGERKGEAAAGNKQHLRAAQEVLKERGMYEGQVDGIMGPKTQAALREFQKKEGLRETGRLDQQTMSRLGVDKTGATGSTSPAASPPSGTSQQKDQPATGASPQKDQPASSGTSGSAGAPKDDRKK